MSGHVIILCVMFRRTTVFSATAVPLQVLTSRARGFRFLLANSSYFWVLTITVLTGVRRYLTLGSICISLTICDVDHLGMDSLTICIYFFWSSVCASTATSLYILFPTLVTSPVRWVLSCPCYIYANLSPKKKTPK